MSHLIILGDKSLIKSIWRRHLIICLFLVLLAVPIYCLDLALLGGRGGGNWIILDFRGLIFWTYITLLAIHVTLSSMAVLLFPRSGALRIHFGSMVLSLILLVAGFVVYGKVLRAVHADNVRITLYLFKARSAPAAGDIANVFINSPHQDNDGEYFYGVLPAPSRPAKLTLPRLRTESRLQGCKEMAGSRGVWRRCAKAVT